MWDIVGTGCAIWIRELYTLAPNFAHSEAPEARPDNVWSCRTPQRIALITTTHARRRTGRWDADWDVKLPSRRKIWRKSRTDGDSSSSSSSFLHPQGFAPDLRPPLDYDFLSWCRQVWVCDRRACSPTRLSSIICNCFRMLWSQMPLPPSHNNETLIACTPTELAFWQVTILFLVKR